MKAKEYVNKLDGKDAEGLREELEALLRVVAGEPPAPAAQQAAEVAAWFARA